MTQTTQKFWSGLLIFGLAISFSDISNGQVLLRDDFNGTGNVDTNIFRLPIDGEGIFVGRTQFRGDPSVDIPQQGITVADGGGTTEVAEIHLDTFSPIDPGNQFLGTDLLTERNFARGGGLSIEARLRLSPTAQIGPPGAPTSTGSLPGGVINGFFTFDVVREVPPGSGNAVRDEIDFELLSNEVVSGDQRIFTNVFNDDGFSGPESAGDGAFSSVAGLDLTEFQTYRIDWTPNAVQWFVNDQLVRTQTTDVPEDPQQLHLNIWAPGSEFAEAFDAALNPAATESDNQRFTSQIDFVEVSRFNTTTSANLLADPSFEENDTLFASQQFTGFDPAVNGTTTGEWFQFGNVNIVSAGSTNAPSATDPDVDGFNVVSAFGPFFENGSGSGFLQNVAVSPGQELEASVLAQTVAEDSIADTGNFTILDLFFLDAAGNVLEENAFQTSLLDGRDPNITEDEFIEGIASAIVPDDAAFARVQVTFVQLDSDPDADGDQFDGGSVSFESASLTLLTADTLPVIDGDFNDDGVVNAADFTLFRDSVGSPDSAINDAGDGVNPVGIGDFNVFVSNFGNAAGTSSVAAATAIPEPASLVLVGGLLLAAVGRGSRRR